MEAVESSGNLVDESGGITVQFDHLTGIVTGTVHREEERAGLLERLSEAIRAGRLEDRLVILEMEPVAALAPAPAAPPRTILSPLFSLEKGGDLILVLAGTVPSEVGELSQLQYLQVNNNPSL